MTYENINGEAIAKRRASFKKQISELNEEYKIFLDAGDCVENHIRIFTTSDSVYFNFIDNKLPMPLMQEVENIFQRHYIYHKGE